MIMPEDEYIKISHGAKTFENIQPKVPTLNKAADKRDQQMQQYREQLDAYEKAEELQDQLRALILQAVPHTYIGTLKDNQTGFGNVTPKQLLDHLMKFYGTIQATDLQNNLKKLATPWDPDTSIETVFNNGKECRQFAEEGGEKITDSVYMWTLISVFRAAGVFATAIRKWEFKPEDQKRASISS
jgi:hypothetical protein